MLSSMTTEHESQHEIEPDEVQFNVRLRPTLRRQIESFANERGVSLRSVAEDALVLHLARYGREQ
jgi:predicted HicB family RNase H-like nuclease